MLDRPAPTSKVIRGGVRVLRAGVLAVRYRELGGDVRALGEPDPAIYRPVLERLGISAERTLAVGDSLRTDIAGAAAMSWTPAGCRAGCTRPT